MTPREHRVVIERLLGTRVMVRLRGEGDLVATERAIIAEIERLEDLLSAFRPESEWCRWRRGEVASPAPEIVALLDLAAYWFERSGGAFHPTSGALHARWLRAVDEQTVPDRDEMAELAASVAHLPYRVLDGRDGRQVEPLGDCTQLDLHAIAKGWIIDRGLDVLSMFDGIIDALLDAGGDMRHVGPDAVTIGVEDPRRPFDNVPPLEQVRISNEAIASSSGARRPHRIGRQRFTHVLDPRTGWPVGEVLGTTVIAPDAATADAAATVVGVLPVVEGLAFVESLSADERRVATSLLEADGTVHRSARWPD